MPLATNGMQSRFIKALLTVTFLNIIYNYNCTRQYNALIGAWNLLHKFLERHPTVNESQQEKTIEIVAIA